jgi:hypothetical protein
MDERLQAVRQWFDRIYLEGVPCLAPNATAFLGFICVLTAIEALAGYRYAENPNAGERFREFVASYFERAYGELAEDLWHFRNGMIHGFSPRRFALTENKTEVHLQRSPEGTVLNFEDFSAALQRAAQRYFAELEGSAHLQAQCLARITSGDGGGIAVGPMKVVRPEASA